MVCSTCSRVVNPLYDIEKARSEGRIEKISVDNAYHIRNRYISEYEVTKGRGEDPLPAPYCLRCGWRMDSRRVRTSVNLQELPVHLFASRFAFLN